MQGGGGAVAARVTEGASTVVHRPFLLLPPRPRPGTHPRSRSSSAGNFGATSRGGVPSAGRPRRGAWPALTPQAAGVEDPARRGLGCGGRRRGADGLLRLAPPWQRTGRARGLVGGMVRGGGVGPQPLPPPPNARVLWPLQQLLPPRAPQLAPSPRVSLRPLPPPRRPPLAPFPLLPPRQLPLLLFRF